METLGWVLLFTFPIVLGLICKAKYNKWEEEHAKEVEKTIRREKIETFNKKLLDLVRYDINHIDSLWDHFYCFIVESLRLLDVEIKFFFEDNITLKSCSVAKWVVEKICNEKPRDARMNWQQDLVSRLRTLADNPEVLIDVANSIPDSEKYDCIDKGSTNFWYYFWSFVLQNEQCVCWFENYINDFSERQESMYNEYIRNHPLEYTMRCCTREIVQAVDRHYDSLSLRTDSALSAVQAEFDRQNNLITTAAVASIAQHILK